jgi:hypothetical protein
MFTNLAIANGAPHCIFTHRRGGSQALSRADRTNGRFFGESLSEFGILVKFMVFFLAIGGRFIAFQVVIHWQI